VPARVEERGRRTSAEVGVRCSESARNDGCTGAIIIPLQREFLTVAQPASDLTERRRRREFQSIGNFAVSLYTSMRYANSGY